jgi:hypothetical protein
MRSLNGYDRFKMPKAAVLVSAQAERSVRKEQVVRLPMWGRRCS